jgi:hypothetical protein
LLDFSVTAVNPFCRVLDNIGSDHIHIDIY